MRRVLAGIFTLLILPTFALAEIRGDVESIGFGPNYRPNCHIPMLIKILTDTSGTFQIRVVQEDLDRDQEIFVQTISLTGGEDGRLNEQRFWMYFIPQPTDGGLPDLTRGGNLADLQKAIKVFLCDEKGKQLAQLPVTSTIKNIENDFSGAFTATRGVRFIAAVSDGPNQPVWHDYQAAIGTIENVVFEKLRSMDLPEDIRGYEMVDAIVWLAAALPDPNKPSDEKRYKALQAYVRGGGHLVICQPAQRDATASVAEMLPVVVNSVEPRNNVEPLRKMATEWREKLPKRPEDETGFGGVTRREDWPLLQGQFMFAKATLKPGAIAEPEMIEWADGSATPYIARIGYGTGCVTWVAHDLSDPAIVGTARSGWPFVWDRVLDYKHDLIIIDNQTSEVQKRVYAPGSATDVGHSLIGGMDLTSKSRWLVSIAVVFFIAYWVIAGPGVYFYLLTRSRPQLSWFLFAASAVVATLITMLVVRLVVRGAPELSHVTVVRGGSNETPIAVSRFGLYVPRDEPQQLVLSELAPRNVSYLTAYPLHPSHTQGDIEFPAQLPYTIPIRDAADDAPFEVTISFRSTLKKLQIRRVGQLGGIEGSGKLRGVEGVYKLEGQLTNGTGNRLRNVHMIYHDPQKHDDWILYQPAWEKSATIDLSFFEGRWLKFIGGTTTEERRSQLNAIPEDRVPIRGRMGTPGQDYGWSHYWFQKLRSSSFGNANVDDLDEEFKKSLAIMSVFTRLPPMQNLPAQQGDRVEILRRGGRYLDMSNAIAAGRLVVIAEAEGKAPLPFPFDVSGERVAGKGLVFYQYALPLTRIEEPATTQPGDNAQPAATSQPVALHTNLEAATAEK